MVTLARTQERELRAWLYGRAPTLAARGCADAIDAMAVRVEREQHVRSRRSWWATPISTTCPCLVSALGRGLAQTPRGTTPLDGLSVYVESRIRDQRVRARPRHGFDPGRVPPRRGMPDSIIGPAWSGTAGLRSGQQAGAGTEIREALPRRLNDRPTEPQRESASSGSTTHELFSLWCPLGAEFGRAGSSEMRAPGRNGAGIVRADPTWCVSTCICQLEADLG